MTQDELVKSVGQRMIDCNSHHIFAEYGGRVEKGMSPSDAAQLIVDQRFDEVLWEEVGGMNWLDDNVDLDFLIACRQYRQGKVGPEHVVLTWNKSMHYNGETHGTIFTGLFKYEDYEFLNELMNDINNDFRFDT